jgi:prepilin-type processing-associated H-X9-DG protein
MSRRGTTLIEILVVIGMMSLLFGLTLSAIHIARSVALKRDCSNRLRQAAIALQSHHDLHGTLPQGGRSPNAIDPMIFSGWLLSIMPQLGEENIWTQSVVDYQNQPRPFGMPGHRGLSHVMPTFICPMDQRIIKPAMRDGNRVAFTSYLGVLGYDPLVKNGVLFMDSRIRMSQISDGTSNTLMIGERPPSHDLQLGWWYAGTGSVYGMSGDMILGVRSFNDAGLDSESSCQTGVYPFHAAQNFNDPCGQFHFWSPHSGGSHFAFCDGSVRFMKYDANRILPALASRAGQESVEVP